MTITTQVTSEPDATGHFGPYGGRFVPEVLMAPLEELEQAYRAASSDPAFQAEPLSANAGGEEKLKQALANLEAHPAKKIK